MKVVVGLGNPGKKYDGTRHNVGFLVIDALAKGTGASGFSDRFDAEIAECMEGNEKVLFAKPQTFMNLSGRSVRQILDFYQIPVENLLVVCDDVNLPLGKLRFRAKGSAGGHNGLKDIQNHLGTQDYARLRVGVDAPPESGMVDFVLGKFKPAEKPVMEAALMEAVQGSALWVHEGIGPAMNRFNA